MLYPNHVVIGVDRSLARLNKNNIYSQQSANGAGNLVLVRAELADFWRCWIESPIGKVDKHLLLYPNPYPKKRRFQNRWYAHPAFPLLMQLGGNEIIVRSNWKRYLEDFAAAASILSDLQDLSFSPAPRFNPASISVLDPSSAPWTSFETKYFNVGETCFQLQMRK
jgi:tRNA (guanine-N7-)-methyltransferase